MRLSPLTSNPASSALWTGVAVALAGLAFVGLFYFDLALELMVLVVVLSLAAMYVGSRPAYTVVFLAIFLSIFLNNANYTFFNFSAEGERLGRSAETQLLVLLRLPLVLFAVGLVLAKYGGQFSRFLLNNWDVVIFVLVPFCSVLFSPDKMAALQYAVWFSFSLLTILGFVYLLGVHVPSKFWGEHVAWLLFAGYILVSVLVLYSLPSYFGGILSSAFSHSNFYAYACPVVLVAVLVLDRQRRIPGNRLVNRIPYWLLLAIGVVNLVPILWSGKRSAVVAAGLALLIYLLANRSAGVGTKSSSLGRTILVTAVFGAAVWMAIPRMDTTIMRFERLFDPSVEDQSLGARQDVWRTSLNLVAEEFPVLGVGLANGATATRELAAIEEGAGSGLHSTYLAVFIEMGAVGLLFFIILGFRSLRLFFSCPVSFKWNLVILAVPAVLISATEYSLVPGQAVFWPLWLAVLLPRVVLVPWTDTSFSKNEATL